MTPEQIIAQLAVELARTANTRDRALAEIQSLQSRLVTAEKKIARPSRAK